MSSGERRIALVTGDIDEPLASHAARVDAPLRNALTSAGAVVSSPSWRADVDWSGFDLAVVRTTWDYPPRRDAFLAWAEATEQVTRLVNPADVLRWNTHKSYLIELEERGAPIVPTAWFGAGDRVRLADLLEVRGWDRAVLKPAVGIGSRRVLRVTRREDDADGTEQGGFSGPEAAQEHLDRLLADGDALVQPYLDAFADDGELSVIVIDGEPSHAVRKLPAQGDFRVQSSHGGTYVAEPLERDIAELARWIIEATGSPMLLARVDLVGDRTGPPQLVELEATEPDLLLDAPGPGHDPNAAARVAAAVLARARA